MTESISLVSRLLQLARKFNSFYLEGLPDGVLPLVVAGYRVGLVRRDVLPALCPETFPIVGGMVGVKGECPEDRTWRVDAALKAMRSSPKLPSICRTALAGWRNEYYDVKPLFSSESLFKIDRSACCMFGICKYGVEIVGYVRDPDQGLCLWLQKRSSTKDTWPGKWDNMVSGGLSVGFSVHETALKEAAEEASIPDDLLNYLKPAGTVSFFYQSERGLFPNTEFVYDLELPLNFTPSNRDGEVELFELVPLSMAVERLFSTQFKTTSCPVFIDFLIRHGIISPNNEPDYPELVELLHVPLQMLYTRSDWMSSSSVRTNGVIPSDSTN